MSRIGEQIKEARNIQKLTQKQLAKKVGVAEKYIQEIEAGTKIINQDILDKIIKAVDAPINDSVIFENYNEVKEEKQNENVKFSKPSKISEKVNDIKNQPEIQEVWSNALSGVLADIPVFDYELSKKLYTIQLPIISKKVEGYSVDKVLYIKIMNNDMSGFRICENDIAFCLNSHEVCNNTICLLEYNREKIIRQIKKLDNNNLLLISNSGSIRTETASIKQINILAKLLKVEFTL